MPKNFQIELLFLIPQTTWKLQKSYFQFFQNLFFRLNIFYSNRWKSVLYVLYNESEILFIIVTIFSDPANSVKLGKNSIFCVFFSFITLFTDLYKILYSIYFIFSLVLVCCYNFVLHFCVQFRHSGPGFQCEPDEPISGFLPTNL